jgi:hypothetical protein
MTEFKLGRFSVNLPELFEHHTTTFVGPKEDAETVRLAILKKQVTFRPNLVITRSAESIAPNGLAAYVDAQIGALSPLKGFRQLGRENVSCRAGAQGIMQHHAFDNNDGINIEQYQLYLQLDDYALIATTSHLAGASFERYRAQFRDILLGLAIYS